jgi:hypothetical protein
MRGTATVHPRSAFLAIALVLALAVGAPASSSFTPPAASLEVTVAPKPVVTAGGRVLASARFANEGAGRLSQVKITFEVPAGSFEFASPADGCSVKGALVTCEIGKVSGGETVEQFVALTAPEGASEAEVVAKATFRGDGGHPKVDSDATGVTAAGNPDEVGTCSTQAGTLATEPTAGAANPQSTSVEFSESVVLPCTPVSVGEQERTPDNPGCPPGETCTTQVSFVTIPALPQPAVVTITFTRDVLPHRTKPRNFVLWETPDKFPAEPIRQVQACPMPAGEDSCIVKVRKIRKKGLQVVLEVIGSGDDPRYTG